MYIGGFFELAFPDKQVNKSLVEHWRLPDNPAIRFINARSALASLLLTLSPKRAWLPAYICSSVIEAFNSTHIPFEFYSVGEQLEPDIAELEKNALSGDLILGINYFGRSPGQSFKEFVKRRNDLIFIEDCAQSIDTENEIWGNWRLFSPRKLVGVADGGYAIATDLSVQNKLQHSQSDGNEANRWLAAFLRYEDKDALHNLKWHQANQEKEQSMKACSDRMSYLSHEILSHMDVSRIIHKRKCNYNYLYKSLSSVAFYKNKVLDYCPFGFPIRLSAHLRSILMDELIKFGIFPAIHWSLLPSPHSQFPIEHQLSKEILTLPCDQRYSLNEMERMSHSILKILERYS